MNDGQSTTSSLYVWLAKDLDGIEGIVSWDFGGNIMTLQATELKLAQRLRPLAHDAAVLRGQTARLVRFERGEELEQTG